VTDSTLKSNYENAKEVLKITYFSFTQSSMNKLTEIVKSFLLTELKLICNLKGLFSLAKLYTNGISKKNGCVECKTFPVLAINHQNYLRDLPFY
jgi:hypothetical protein